MGNEPAGDFAAAGAVAQPAGLPGLQAGARCRCGALLRHRHRQHLPAFLNLAVRPRPLKLQRRHLRGKSFTLQHPARVNRPIRRQVKQDFQPRKTLKNSTAQPHTVGVRKVAPVVAALEDARF